MPGVAAEVCAGSPAAGASCPLSIVVPVLNEATHLPEALRALQPLRAQGAQLVVVDGGSSDGSPALATPLADRVLMAPRGRATQMNAGAAACTSARLLFLHADTRLPPGAMDAVMDALATHTWGRFDVRIDSPRATLRMVSFMMNLRSRVSGIATGDQAIFVRREAFDAVGGFEQVPLMEDLLLSRALRRLGRPACLRLRVRTSARRWEQGGVWHTIALMWRLRLAFFLGAPVDDLAQRYDHARQEARDGRG